MGKILQQAIDSLNYDYLYALLAFAFGALAGYQGIYEVYGTYSNRALRFVPGFAYIFSRGLFPAIIFALLYHYGLIHQYLWLQAAACGTGWELFIRSKLYVKKIQRTDEKAQELYKGPLDVVRWYQQLFLRAIDPRFAKDKIDFVGRILPAETAFLALADTALNRLEAWNDRELKRKLKASIGKLVDEFKTPVKGQEEPKEKQIDEKYRYLLCYLIINAVGREATRTLIAGPLK